MLTDEARDPKESEGSGQDAWNRILTRDPAGEALLASLVEIEHHVSSIGWDQPARLFALVDTTALITAEPHLAGQLHVTAEGSLTSIEQDEFHAGEDLAAALARLRWSDAVSGCAIALERAFLPSSAEAAVPSDPAEATAFVQVHPQRQDVRVVVGVLRSGQAHALARLVSRPDQLLSGADLVPALAAALAETFV